MGTLAFCAPCGAAGPRAVAAHAAAARTPGLGPRRGARALAPPPPLPSSRGPARVVVGGGGVAQRGVLRAVASAAEARPGPNPAPASGGAAEQEDCDANSIAAYRIWYFKGFRCCYAVAGELNTDGPDVVLVHGFGANCRHWRRNIGPLAARGFRVFAMDLLGFGLGDMPAPGTLDSEGVPVQYTFEYWSEQLLRFCRDVVRKGRERDDTAGTPQHPPLFFVANSIGSMVTMQASVLDPELCRGQVLIGPSMRQLHVRKRSWLQSITAPLAMRTLAYRPIGGYFLKSVARPDQLRRVLLMAYAVAEAVDDELIQLLREPALLPGALGVFLAFIMYDTGPIPEDLMPLLSCPSVVIWGELDKFEPYKEGRALRHYATVEQFISLPGVGHCAHDEEPELVNQIVADFIVSHMEKDTVASVDY